MKKIIHISFAFICCLMAAVNAQNLSPTVSPTGGGYATGGGNSLSWTMGETFNATLTGGSKMLSQGEQQPEIDLLTGTVSLTICAGSAVTVPFTATGYVDAANVFTAQLSNASGSFASPVNIGTVAAVLSGTINATIPPATPAGAGYRIRIVSGNPVYNGRNNGANILINASALPSISGATSFCSGNSTILDAGVFTSYIWSTGASTQTISVNATGTYIVTVTNGVGCTGTSSKTVTVNPNPSTTITGASTGCAPANIPLNAGGGFSSYGWSTGASTQTISVNTTGTYTITVTNTFGCTGTATKEVTVSSSLPVQPGVITGDIAVCKNSNEPYSIALVPGATSYTWTATSGATVSTGQGSANAVINFSNAAANASLSVIATNVCGNSIARTLAYIVSSASPSTPSTINGSLYGVCGQTNVPYNCPAAANALSYTWTVPAGAIILTGQGTNSITVKYSSFTTTGIISVTAENGCGSSPTTSRTVNAKTAQPVISGQNWACTGQAGLVYSVAPVAGASNYTWTIVTGSTLVSGQGTTSITVNWGSINGQIKCIANNSCGSGLSAALAVAFTCKEEGPLEEFSQLSLYPNPASTSATLQFDGYAEGKAPIAVYDFIGKQLINRVVKVTTGNNEYKLDLENYPKGVYIVRVIYNGVTRNSKLVVQ